MKGTHSQRKTRKKDPDRYPKGLNPEKVRDLIDFYENQSDDISEIASEAAPSNDFTVMAIPIELVPQVQRLIAKRPS
jgi:hypothetical protein